MTKRSPLAHSKNSLRYALITLMLLALAGCPPSPVPAQNRVFTIAEPHGAARP